MKHYHRYRRVKLGKKKDYIVYACQEPDCKHYIVPDLLIGKIASCYNCRALFTVSRDQVRPGRQYAKLTCPNCKKGIREKKIDMDRLDAFISKLGFASGE